MHHVCRKARRNCAEVQQGKLHCRAVCPNQGKEIKINPICARCSGEHSLNAILLKQTCKFAAHRSTNKDAALTAYVREKEVATRHPTP